MSNTQYYAKSTTEIVKLLKTSSQGLSNHEAEQRIYKYGLNELKKGETISSLKILLNQFTSPIVWILIVAIIISLFLKENLDSIVIAAIIVLNTVLGFFQEYKAEKAIDALKKMASPKARVIRNGKEVLIDSNKLVPGDILVLREGDKISADARLIEIHSLNLEEASLTGESQPVQKNILQLEAKTRLADRKNMVFSATSVTSGNGKAIVTATGMDSQVGKIAKLIQESHSVSTPLQNKLKELGKYLTIAVILVAIVTFLTGIFTGKPLVVMILTALALAVAAIPEGLPAVITISLALGVQRMVKRNALVRKLPSVETLGSVTVICTDKTGTLTHNQMTVKKIWANDKIYDISGVGYSSKGNFSINGQQINGREISTLLKSGIYCNNSKLVIEKGRKQVMGDPTEAALLISAKKANLSNSNLQRMDEIPFTSERKMMTTIHKQDLSYSKGAVEIILSKCDRILLNGKIQRLQKSHKDTILKQNENFAKETLRVLAFSYNNKFIDKESSEKNMIFLGLQAMLDPPRKEVKESIKKCKTAGIKVIMITGDHLTTAQAIATKLNIKGKAITGQELEKINLNNIINSTTIFARVEPAQKLKIIHALKKQGQVVAMTGDGVNDAPALKKADIGISMGIMGTDVAKESSDMILTDDNFSSIVNAVEEGRGIFDNIRKFVNYLLSSNLGEILVIFLATMFGMPLPLTAIQILWINLVTDGLPAIALSLDPAEKNIMKRKPRSPRENIISKSLGTDIIFLGSLMAFTTLVLFWLYRGSPLAKAQTVVFTALVVFEIARLQLIRGKYKLSLFSNWYLVGAVLLSLGLQVILIYSPLRNVFGVVPLELLDWVWILIASTIIIIINKLFYKFKS
jgi:P-type Ca2+ transporter type 2C